MSNDVSFNENNYQEEYIFPNLESNSDYENEIELIKIKSFPYKFLLILFIVLWISFIILAMYYDGYQSKKTGMILGGVSFVFMFAYIIDIYYVTKIKKETKNIEFKIAVNNQYTDYILEGYTKKEAYKLTVEWIDRQAAISAANEAAAAALCMGAICMSHTINHNHY
jgi:hypothetical protein